MTPKTLPEAHTHIEKILSKTHASQRQKEIIALKVMCKLWLHEAGVPNMDNEYKVATRLIDILESKGILKG